MTIPPVVETWASQAARKAAFEAAVRQDVADSNERTKLMLAPRPPVMREITVQANRPPILLIGILILGYLLVTAKGGAKDWE